MHLGVDAAPAEFAERGGEPLSAWFEASSANSGEESRSVNIWRGLIPLGGFPSSRQDGNSIGRLVFLVELVLFPESIAKGSSVRSSWSTCAE